MTIWEQFLHASKMTSITTTPAKSGQPQPMTEEITGERIALSDWQPEGGEMAQMIAQRRTERAFAEQSLSLDELSYLLWATQGDAGFVDKKFLRTVPSAGAVHPLDTLVLVRNVASLAQGLYRYLPEEHTLVAVNTEEDIHERILTACRNQRAMQKDAVSFLWSADVRRAYWRFGERAWRYVFLDAGHVCQNLYLAAESIGCGVCAIGAYDDDALNALLGLDGIDQFAVYLGAVGKK